MKLSAYAVLGAVILSLAVGLGGGVALDRLVLLNNATPTEPADARPVFGTFWQAWRLVQQHYVDPAAATPRKLTDGAIAGMLDALGDTGHTRYLSPTDRKIEASSLQGKLEGIGIEVETRNGAITVVAPLDNSPAKRAGIHPGDVIEKVNGQDVTRMSLDQVSQLIRGPKGTSVTLTVLRAGTPELLTFTVQREEISFPDVTWSTVPGEHIAHVRVASFGQTVDDQLRTALTQAKAAGDGPVILDLRNDPGGILGQSVKVASEFLTSGNVLLERDRSGHEDPLPVEPGGLDPKVKLVVLVNRGTASAAEIVAGAIQDHHRGLIVGEQTFGTGTVLQEYSLDDGSAILLGVREWLTPNGHFIRNNGIVPDRVVAEPSSVYPLIPGQERTMSVEQFQRYDDQQLIDAVQLAR